MAQTVTAGHLDENPFTADWRYEIGAGKRELQKEGDWGL